MTSPLAASTPTDGRDILRRHGKSFHFAGHLLPEDSLKDCARLYTFCRYVDDLADCSANTMAAREALSSVYEDIKRGRSSRPFVMDFLRLAETHKIDTSIVLELIYGLEGDLDGVAVASWNDLIRYCFRAAGTVGIMMADILGAREREARFHAIDLGIAMQLTNIARDVQEDALAGRRYIPADLLPGLSCRQIASPDRPTQSLLRKAVQTILDKAEDYYESGEAGLRYLPPRARVAILVAARVYRQIGKELETRNCATWEGRAVVSMRKKLTVAAGCMPRFFKLEAATTAETRHRKDLHRFLAGLPKTHFGGLPS